MLKPARLLFLLVAVTLAAVVAIAADSSAAAIRAQRFYELNYRAELQPRNGKIHVELHLSGERLPSKLVFNIDPQRHQSFTATDPLTVTGQTVSWQPRGKFARLTYDFVVNHKRSGDGYDSLMTTDWALFRGDKMVPRARVTAPRSLQSRATLTFKLPQGWSAITPYERAAGEPRAIDDKQRRFDRPAGWILAGRLGTRSETIAGIHTIIASPEGDGTRRQDLLAFLNWNLPQLATVFQSFPPRLLIVSAGDPMWHGGLSAPASLFVHSGRPLISENRTSTLLHELAHVAMGIHGDAESDWIVEGFAEFYSIETLHRSGGISTARYDDAMRRLTAWATHAPTLFVKASTGAATARAVIALRRADEEIRKVTGGKATLDNVARELAHRQGEVSLELLQSIAASVTGQRVRALERQTLLAPIGP